MAINCFRYLGFTTFDQVDRLTIAQYEVMMDALELTDVGSGSCMSTGRLSLNLAVQAQKKAGKGKTRPAYRRFRQFFDYGARSLKKIKSRKEEKRGPVSRESGSC